MSQRLPRVLIVDDEPMLLRVLQRCVRGHCEAQLCSGGAEAIAWLLADPDFDVILCDLMMPVGGVQVYRTVTARLPHLAERFVFLSGAAFAPETQAFLAALPNACLDKPFEVQDVLEVVDQVAGGTMRCARTS